jgi:hypothetical protein
LSGDLDGYCGFTAIVFQVLTSSVLSGVRLLVIGKKIPENGKWLIFSNI